VTISLALRHPQWGPLALPLRAIRKKGQRRGRGRPRSAFTVKWRQAQIQLGQTSRAESGVGDNRLHSLWQNDHQDVQIVSGNLWSGWRCPLCQCEWACGTRERRDHGWYAFFCTDPTASVQEILETFADRATIEQALHYVKVARGEGSVGHSGRTPRTLSVGPLVEAGLEKSRPILTQALRAKNNTL